MVIAAHVDGLALRGEDLGVDLRGILAALLRHSPEPRPELGVLGARRQRLGPVERQVEVAAAVVDLPDLARRRLVVVEELADRLVERLREERGALVAERAGDVLERGGERR